MTITVTAPNGATVNFPDGTDHETINGVMTQNFHTDKSAPPPDKFQQAAIDEAKANPAIDEGAGYTRRLIHGATMGADSTLAAGLFALPEAIKHGTGIREGYNYAKAREDRGMDEARKNTGLLGDATEMLGGAASAGNVTSGVGGLARDVKNGFGAIPLTEGGRAGNIVSAPSRAVSFGANLAPDAGLIARSLASAGDAAAIGGLSGVTEGNGIGERLENAAKGAGTGLAIGGALPATGAIVKGVLSAPIAHLRAKFAPESFAESQIARAVHESGQTPQQLGQRVADANAEGTPMTLADALGNPGQRMLSTVTRAPGEGRTAAVNFLDNRQAGQGRRVTNALTEGFDSRLTPEALEGNMTAARGAQADADYGAVRNDANPVDVTNVLDHIDNHLEPFGVPHDREAADGITGRMRAYRRMLGGNGENLDGSAAGGLNDFNAAHAVRHDLADEIDKAVRAGENNKARLLGGVRTRLDSALEDASPGFRQANADFRGASQDINAIDQGRTAATRGRTEDTIPAFNALRPRGQQAFRSGYVDPQIQATQGAAPGVNKARPLMNDAFQDEAAAIAPRNAQMQRRIADENTMFETRNQALGGSKTADNLNDHAALGVSPSLVHNVITGNWHGAIGNIVSAGHTGFTGNTAPVRAAVGRMLLDRGVNPANLQTMVGQTIARIQFMQQLSRGVGRSGTGALAVTRPGQTSN